MKTVKIPRLMAIMNAVITEIPIHISILSAAKPGVKYLINLLKIRFKNYSHFQ